MLSSQHLTSVAFLSGERGGRPCLTDSLTTPIVQTATYTFKDTAQLIAFQVKKARFRSLSVHFRECAG
jgi:O-acetylhomoserine/O-acetylserine sulfhydrylase-like pyridoxal-dependent enzyme